jgi:hypothetical protein
MRARIELALSMHAGQDMTRSPSATRLLLALAPLLGLASACEHKDGPEPVGDSKGDSDSSTTDPTEGSDPDDDPESGSDDCLWLVGDANPDEVLAAWSASESWGPPEHLVWCKGEHSVPCTTADGKVGTSHCVVSGGAEQWTSCSVDHECDPDTEFDQGECQGEFCAVVEGVLTISPWWAEDPCCGTTDPCCVTPLVVSFDGEPIRFEAAGAAAFDIGGQGACLSTDWPTQPWLAIDRDGDGIIGSGRELFGSGTIMTTGVRAGNGFEALGEFDVDRDGKITAADPIFHELVLWSDHDSDRRGALGELVPVAQAELVAIDLGFGRRYDCDERGNCGVERSAFEFRDALGAVRSGEIVDVHLPCQ